MGLSVPLDKFAFDFDHARQRNVTISPVEVLTNVRSASASFDAYFESFVSLTFKHAWSPTVTFWREYGRLSTNYVEFSVSPSVSLNEKTRLSFRPYVGFFENSNDYYGADIAVNHDFDKGFYGRASVTLIKSSFGGERASFGVSTGYRW